MAKETIVDFGFRHRDENEPAAGPAQGPATPPPEPVSERFLRKAEQWKRDLLDVTRRNRAINHRATRATLALPTEPQDLWELLLVVEGATKFTARHFAPQSAGPVEDEAAKEAFAAAGRLIERARLADREQGIQVLFAALGWLNWVDAEGHELRSPLVLAPVDLAFDRQEKELTLQAAADDAPEVNPSLAYLLHSQHGVRLPQLEDAEGEPLNPSLAAYLEQVALAVSKQPGWRVELDGPVVDVFTFAKLAMVDEIDHSLERLAGHLLLRALAGDAALPEPAEPAEGLLDTRYPAGALRTVVESDAYQAEAVGLAAAGLSFVIEGPPGTGKSQTITNIAAELMASGKRVLFVAEKRVAREVVLENLQKAGLGEACLHLASNAGARSRADAKAQVIKEIVDTLDAGPPPPQPDNALPRRYGEMRQRLNAYAEAVARPLGEGGWTTPFELIGNAIATAADRRENVAVPAIDGRSRYWLDDVVDVAKSLDAFPAGDLELLAGPWVDFQWTTLDDGREQRLTGALETLSSLATGLESAAEPALGANGPAAGLSLKDARAFAGRLDGVARYRKKLKSFLRFVDPGFYGARGDRKSYLALGYTETGDEGDRAAQVREVLACAESALAVAGDAFGAATPAEAPVAGLSAWAAALRPGLARLPVVAEMAGALKSLEPLEMRAAFSTLLADTTARGRLADVVPATAWASWARTAAQAELAMQPDQHGRLVDSFARLDSEMLGWARTAVLAEVRSRRPRSVNHSAMAPLVKYARAKRRPSLRAMLGNTREAVQLLKPTLLMSPLAAAQYLCHGDGRTYRFDAVIVDEASMVPTPDMVVALSLAPQAIIVGDSRQMPPTNFFNKEISPLADDQSQEEDVTFESILDEAAPVLPSTMLRAHYRSRDEALIAFSNVYFYDGRLIACPDAWGSRAESGVRFEFVGDAVYGRGKSRANPAEAKRTIDLLRTELAMSEGKRQVAVTAMSIAQQSEILEQMESAAALDPVLRGWLDGGGLVRNLETVQGDESDVMLLSVGYGKDAEGRLFMNFGPLGQEKGERRLNVAITRARWKTVVVASIRGSDIDPARTSSVGALRLRDYLDYAERGPAALPATASGANMPMSAFEQSVVDAAAAHGLACLPRVGVAGYQVGIAVRHPEDPERFVLAIECDGPAYSSAPAARDREIGRPAVLERMGWNVHRVFAPAWFRQPEAELDRLLERYRQAILS